jgi:hypothetical protein
MCFDNQVAEDELRAVLRNPEGFEKELCINFIDRATGKTLIGKNGLVTELLLTLRVGSSGDSAGGDGDAGRIVLESDFDRAAWDVFVSMDIEGVRRVDEASLKSWLRSGYCRSSCLKFICVCVYILCMCMQAHIPLFECTQTHVRTFTPSQDHRHRHNPHDLDLSRQEGPVFFLASNINTFLKQTHFLFSSMSGFALRMCFLNEATLTRSHGCSDVSEWDADQITQVWMVDLSEYSEGVPFAAFVELVKKYQLPVNKGSIKAKSECDSCVCLSCSL